MIDPSISLQTRPVQVDSPIDSYGKALSLKALMMQNQVAGQNIADTQRLRQIYQDPTAQDPASLRDLLYKSGVPGGVSTGVALDKDVLANKKEQLLAQKAQLDNFTQQHGLISAQLNALGQNPPIEQIGQTFQHLLANGVKVDPSKIPQNQAEVPAWIQKQVAEGQTAEQQLAKANQDWEHQWKLSQPQSDYGRTLSDVERLSDPNFKFNNVGGLGLKVPGQPAQQPMPVTSTDVTDQSSGAMLRQPAEASVTAPTPLQQPGTEPTTAPPVGVSGRDNATLALWHSSGGKAPEGTVPYVENGEVKFKVDPAWLQGKTDIARAGASIITQNAGPKAFIGKFGDEMAAQLASEQKSAQRAQSTIQTMNKMRGEMDSGMFAGGLADQKVAAVNMLKGIGVPVPDDWQTRLGSAQAFKAYVGSQLLAHAKDLGSNPSNADASRIEGIVGTIGTDPNALKKIMDFNEEMGRKSIDLFNGHYNQVKKDPNAQFGFDMTVNQPAKYAPSHNFTAEEIAAEIKRREEMKRRELK